MRSNIFYMYINKKLIVNEFDFHEVIEYTKYESSSIFKSKHVSTFWQIFRQAQLRLSCIRIIYFYHFSSFHKLHEKVRYDFGYL